MITILSVVMQCTAYSELFSTNIQDSYVVIQLTTAVTDNDQTE